MDKLVHVDTGWTLFLDRDGVINERVFGGYILTFEDFYFKKGVRENAQKLFSKFERIIVVTNQQCVGKGLISSDELTLLHQEMVKEFQKVGARIDKVYSAIELKDEKPHMRKPHSKMAELAKLDFPEIDFNKSIMVGDTDTDILFGKKLGMKTVLIRSEEKITIKPDLALSKLDDLIAFI